MSKRLGTPPLGALDVALVQSRVQDLLETARSAPAWDFYTDIGIRARQRTKPATVRKLERAARLLHEVIDEVDSGAAFFEERQGGGQA